MVSIRELVLAVNAGSGSWSARFKALSAGVNGVFVAASTDCFPQLSLTEALQRMVDLEYSRAEIGLHEGSSQLRPSQVHADLDEAVKLCKGTHRLTIVAFNIELDGPEAETYAQFATCCKLAKALKVVQITVRASELGTPFNGEIERLRELVRIATLEGVVVGVKTEAGRMTQDPATAAVFCDNVKGLAITLDPSHYTFGPMAGVNYDNLFRYTSHVQLRDSNRHKLQTKVGQGEIEYGRIVTQLTKFRYNHALCVNIIDQNDPDIDHQAEMRKIRLLLESLL